MIKKLRLFPYKIGSKGAKDIVNVIGGMRVYPDRNYRPKSNHLIINWGNSILPDWYDWVHNRGVKMLNNPIAVARATNKITTLRYLEANGVPHIPFTTDYFHANEWLEQGDDVVERHIINGTKAQGVKVVKSDSEEALELCQLYTKMIKNAREYRVHVFNGKVIDVQQKKRRNRESDTELISGTIKNVDNGWVFCRENITEYPEAMLTHSINAVKVLGLDFGAVDVLVKNGEVYILEVNTAMGLQGETLNKYVSEIINELNN